MKVLVGFVTSSIYYRKNVEADPVVRKTFRQLTCSKCGRVGHTARSHHNRPITTDDQMVLDLLVAGEAGEVQMIEPRE